MKLWHSEWEKQQNHSQKTRSRQKRLGGRLGVLWAGLWEVQTGWGGGAKIKFLLQQGGGEKESAETKI